MNVVLQRQIADRLTDEKSRRCEKEISSRLFRLFTIICYTVRCIGGCLYLYKKYKLQTIWI